jgi:hypothetical protein
MVFMYLEIIFNFDVEITFYLFSLVIDKISKIVYVIVAFINGNEAKTIKSYLSYSSNELLWLERIRFNFVDTAS